MELIDGTRFWYYRRNNTFYIFGLPVNTTKSLVCYTVRIFEDDTAIMKKYIKTTKTGFRKRLTPNSHFQIMHSIPEKAVKRRFVGTLDKLPSFILEVIKKEIYE